MRRAERSLCHADFCNPHRRGLLTTKTKAESNCLSLSCTVVLHVMCISTADASAGLSRDKSCQLILASFWGRLCCYSVFLQKFTSLCRKGSIIRWPLGAAFWTEMSRAEPRSTQERRDSEPAFASHSFAQPGLQQRVLERIQGRRPPSVGSAVHGRTAHTHGPWTGGLQEGWFPRPDPLW